MKYAIVGGVAAAHWFPEVWGPERPDLDIIAEYDDIGEILPTFGDLLGARPFSEDKIVGFYRDRGPVEVDVAWIGSTNYDILQYTRSMSPSGYATPATLLMMKLSHRYRKDSPHFWKTMTDVYRLRLLSGRELPEVLGEILINREKETYSYSHPKLNVNKEDFFTGDGVKYIVDHDWIHEQVKLGPVPAYQLFGVEGEQVLSSKERFFGELTEEQRLNAVVEESVVLAIERSLLPHTGVLTYAEATKLALSKVCSSITSGWFREYAWENAYPALEMMHVTKRKHFETKVKEILNATV